MRRRCPTCRTVDQVVVDTGADLARGLTHREAAQPPAGYRAEPAHRREATVDVVGRLAQLRDPMNLMLIAVAVVSLLIGQVSTAVIVGCARPAQRAARRAAGAEGPGQRRRAVQAAGPADPGGARRAAGAGPRRGGRPGRRRPARGRRHRARRRPHRGVGHPGDAGGGADRRERADQQGRRDASRPGSRARRPRQHAVPEHLGHPRDRDHGGHRDRHADRDGPDRDDADRRSTAPGRRCRRSSTG